MLSPFRRSRLRPLSLLSALFALGVFASCGDSKNDGDGDSDSDSDADGDDDGDGDGDAPPEPLYGEGGVVPDTLRLKFHRIDVPESNGGTDFSFLPNGDEFLMTTRGGRLLHLRLSKGKVTSLGGWDFAEEMITEGACGPTNVTLDPFFEENSYFYTSYCVDEATTRLMRYTFDESDGPVNPQVIFETVIPKPRDVWHRIGSIGFEDDDIMWFLLGDHFIDEEAQDPEIPFGSLQRIIPSREENSGGHTYPDGNMEEGMGGAGGLVTPHPGVFAYGLRSPWRGTRDRLGRYIIAEVGLVSYEEINLVTAPGQNFGWNLHEGPCQSSCDGFTDPILAYDRTPDHPYFDDDPEATADNNRAIWLAQIYESPAIDRYEGLMKNVVLYGDLFTGWVRALRINDKGAVTLDQGVGHQGSVTAGKVGPDGYLYLLNLSGQLRAAVLEYD